MTECLTTQELYDRVADDVLEILTRDIVLGGQPQETVCKIFGTNLAMILKATQSAPFPIRVVLMQGPIKRMFEIAWQANFENLLDGAYEEGNPSDA